MTCWSGVDRSLAEWAGVLHSGGANAYDRVCATRGRTPHFSSSETTVRKLIALSLFLLGLWAPRCRDRGCCPSRMATSRGGFRAAATVQSVQGIQYAASGNAY